MGSEYRTEKRILAGAEQMIEPVTMPVFVFQRRHHVELEAGFTLAGQLVVDIPKEPSRRSGRCE
jgi:hypothetical protein